MIVNANFCVKVIIGNIRLSPLRKPKNEEPPQSGVLSLSKQP